jgi:hypothetical protein
MAGFDPRYARVVATRFVNENLAEVELTTNTSVAPYPYFVQVERVDARWQRAQPATRLRFRRPRLARG